MSTHPIYDGEAQAGMFVIWPATDGSGGYEGTVVPFGDDGPYRRGLYDAGGTLVRELEPVPRYEASRRTNALTPALGCGFTATGCHGLAEGPLPDAIAGGEFWASLEVPEAER